jgi:hypothetical protein
MNLLHSINLKLSIFILRALYFFYASLLYIITYNAYIHSDDKFTHIITTY